MTKRTWTVLVLIVAAVVVVGACLVAQHPVAPAATTQPAAPEAATATPARGTGLIGPLALLDQDGQTVRLGDHAGKIAVLEWIDPDCPFVQRLYRAQTPKTLARTYGERGVVWLAINSAAAAAPAMNKRFCEEYELPYPVLADPSGRAGRVYGATRTPEVRIFAADGSLAYAGAFDDDPSGSKGSPVNYVAQTLDALLAGEPVTTPAIRPYGSPVLYAPAPPAAPPFTLDDQQGRAVSLGQFAGKIVVLEWVNPDCPFVQRHYRAATMTGLARRYAPHGVVWLAINTTHYFDVEKNQAFHEKHALPYPVLDDSGGQVGRAYEALATPDMRIVDVDGRIAYQGAIDDDPRGEKDEKTNYVAKALDELLAGRAVSIPKTHPYGCSVKYAK